VNLSQVECYALNSVICVVFNDTVQTCKNYETGNSNK